MAKAASEKGVSPTKKKGKKPSATPVRRSTRIAASSRASSAAPSEPDVAQPTEGRRPQAQRWDTVALCNIIEITKDGGFVHTLTHEQKDAVIHELLKREAHFKNRVDELEQENVDLHEKLPVVVAVKQHGRPSLREEFTYGSRKARVADPTTNSPTHHTSNTDAADHAAHTSSTPSPAQDDQEQARASDDATQTEAARSSSPAAVDANPPAVSSTTPPPRNSFQLVRAQTDVQRPRTWFRRVLGSVIAPFSPVRTSQAPTPAQPEEPQQPLGDLTGSRKRTFTQVEPAAEAAAKPKRPDFTAQPTLPSTPKTHTTSRTLNSAKSTRARKPEPSLTTPLTTISEHSEVAEKPASIMEEDTPARPRRTISNVRREQIEKERRANTHHRAWNHTPAPREPNADARLAKLREYRKMEQEIQAMKEDEELKEMLGRPVKRVKLDDLIEIPHHRPGESESTFRVYDEDSDDEMEVDVDVPLRTNIFEQQPDPNMLVDTSENVAPAPPTIPPHPHYTTDPLPPPPIQQPVQKDPEVQEMLAGLPSVGLRPFPELAQPINKLATAKFAYHFAYYEKHGVVLQW